LVLFHFVPLCLLLSKPRAKTWVVKALKICVLRA
jgi:hypothetical protein